MDVMREALESSCFISTLFFALVLPLVHFFFLTHSSFFTIRQVELYTFWKKVAPFFFFLSLELQV